MEQLAIYTNTSILQQYSHLLHMFYSPATLQETSNAKRNKKAMYLMSNVLTVA